MGLLKDLHVVGWPLLLGVVLDAWMGLGWAWDKVPEGWKRWRLEGVLRACLVALHACVAAIAVYVAVGMLRPAFSEWVESGVAAIAWHWVAGGNVYPDAAELKVYGVFPYGPLLFQVVGAVFAVAGRVNAAVKAVFVCCALATYGLMFRVVRRQGVSAPAAALAVEMLAVVVGIMGFMAKADIMLVFIGVAACALVAAGRNQVRMGVGLALLAGAAAAIKIHGAFYVLPAWVECLALRPRHLAAKVVLAGAITAAVAAAPFLVPATSFWNYVDILRTASQDGLLLGIFLSNVAFIGMCVAGVQALGGIDRRLMVSVLAAGILVSVFAAKAEAGPHHLMPLLPYLCLPLGRALEGRFDARRALFFALFLVSFQPVTSVARDVALMVGHWHAGRAVI